MVRGGIDKKLAENTIGQSSERIALNSVSTVGGNDVRSHISAPQPRNVPPL